MSGQYDIAILGAGPGGYVAALEAARRGARVAVVEKHLLGGTCLNYGCIPSKALLASAELLHRIRRAGEMGVQIGGEVGFDWAKIQARKDGILRTLRGGIESLFKTRKVNLVRGRGALAGPGRLAVAREGGAAEELTAGKVILAVGSVPATIPGWPEDRNLVCTSDEALHWKELPRSLLIVGGGVIGCEFACLLESFGVRVTVVEMMDRLLPEMDESLGPALGEVLRKRGIECHAATKVEELRWAEGGVTVRLSNGQEVRADRVLVAVGRRPATADIGLEAVGLATDRGFVRTSDRMETAARGVYCIGDANGRCLLAHAASAQGIAAVANALGADRPFEAPIPNCVYTFPEIASVGLAHHQARAKGVPVAVGMFPLRYLGKAMTAGETDGFVKVLRNRQDGRLVGVHLFGHNVTECVAAAGALLHEKVSARELAEVVFAHPTMSEALKEAAEDSFGSALHLPPRKVLRVAAEQG